MQKLLGKFLDYLSCDTMNQLKTEKVNILRGTRNPFSSEPNQEPLNANFQTNIAVIWLFLFGSVNY